jgi:Nucleotidyltransferase domain
LAGLGHPERQRAFLDRLQRQTAALPWAAAVVVIGSLASGRADAASDVDLLVAVSDNAFGHAWQRRHDLHVTGAVVEWDHWYDEHRRAGTHKWVTSDVVLVEALIATATSSVRLAQPWRLLIGDVSALNNWPTRPPITRNELVAGAQKLHRVEAAFDQLKAELRAARNASSR